MPTIDLPQGTVEYRAAGPANAAGPPVVLVHGALVDATLWAGVQDGLAARGVRSYAPTLPLGAHRTPMRADADLTPLGVARLLVAFLQALDLDDVTLVGNDSGGAICQFLVDADPARIGRLVLTNCDAFETFPPQPFRTLFALGRTPLGALLLLTPMRLRAVRHSPLGFGALARRLDPVQTRDWVAPVVGDRGVRRDFARFLRGVRPPDLVDVGARLWRFDRPVLLVWGAADRYFTLSLAHRLQAVLPDARLVEVPGGLTYLPLEHPDRVVDALLDAFPQHVASRLATAAA